MHHTILLPSQLLHHQALYDNGIKKTARCMQFTADDVKVHSIHQKWIRQLSSNTVLLLPMLLLQQHKKFIEKASSMHFFPLLCTLLYYCCYRLFIPSYLVLDIDEYYNRKYSLGSNAKRAKQENLLQKALLLLIFQNLGKQQEAFLAFKVEDCMFTYFQCLVNFPKAF